MEPRRWSERLVGGAAAALCLAVAFARPLDSQNLALQAYYPSPAGIYNGVVSFGRTALGRAGGDVAVGNAAGVVRLKGLEIRQRPAGDVLFTLPDPHGELVLGNRRPPAPEGALRAAEERRDSAPYATLAWEGSPAKPLARLERDLLVTTLQDLGREPNVAWIGRSPRERLFRTGAAVKQVCPQGYFATGFGVHRHEKTIGILWFHLTIPYPWVEIYCKAY
ncbi:MAG: hypothetical protein HY554_06500 [Elusimicrobia bacterium]|nr:hypothetical protein [Elusimicrobiota bacterium]